MSVQINSMELYSNDCFGLDKKKQNKNKTLVDLYINSIAMIMHNTVLL